MNSTDPRLRDLLDERSQSVHVSVPDLADRAIARDRRNRRREVTTAIGAGALALAVVVPVGWDALAPDGVRPAPAVSSSDAGPTSSATVPPSPLPTSDTGSQDRPTSIPTITLTGAPAPSTLSPTPDAASATARIGRAYVVDGVFHDGDRTVQLPSALARPTQVARLAGGGVLLVMNDSVSLVDSAGKGVERYPGAAVVAVARDLRHFLMSDLDGNVTYHDSSGNTLATLSADTCKCGVPSGDPGGYTAVGLVGTTAYARKGNSGKTVAWDVETGGTRDVAGEFAAVDPVQGLALVKLGGDAGEPLCYDLRVIDTGKQRWRVCGPVLMTTFSSDGELIVGTGSVDGLNSSVTYPGVVVLRASDGALVLESGDPSGPGPWSTSVRVTSAQDIAVEVRHDDKTASVQRCALDGSCEVALPAKVFTKPESDIGALDSYLLSMN